MAGITTLAVKDGAAASQTIVVYDTATGGPYVSGVVTTDGTNRMPTMDAAGRAGFFKLTDGTNTMPSMDVAARPGFVKVTDGTNTMPTMDAAARPGFVKLTDGTNTAPTMDAVARPGFQKITDGTNTMPTADTKGRRLWAQTTDGTNDFLSGSAANLALTTGVNAQLTTFPGEWTATNAPAVGTLASASKALGSAGVRHICTGVSVAWASDGSANGAAQSVTVVLRDGATGAGAILAQWTLGRTTTNAADAANAGNFSLMGLNIPGTAATAMTVEFSGTASSHILYTANLVGYDSV